jgi:hypothetical protein
MTCVLCNEKLNNVRVDLVVHGENGEEQTYHCCSDCFFTGIPDRDKPEERKEAISKRNETILAMAGVLS